MPPYLRFAALSLVIVGACGDNPEPADADGTSAAEEAAPQPDGPPVVRSSITLGTFEGTVSDLAFYEAPPFSFRSAVVAANGDAGIAVVGVDGTSASTWTPEVTANRVTVTYAIDPDGGSVLALSSDGTLSAYTLDGTLLTSVDVPGGEHEDVCAAGGLAAILVDGDIQIVEVGTDDTGDADLSLGPVIETGGIDGCDGTAAGLVFAGDEAQLILNADGNLVPTGQPIEAMPVISAGGTAIGITATNGLIRVSDTSLLVETPDGAPILPRFVEATGGNFGGILRDGAVAVLDDQNTLHVVPWSGVADAAGLEKSADSKRLPIVPTGNPGLFDDQIIAPSVTDDLDEEGLNLPGFEERELPEPPGR
ncbi:MAG: hypothetical protein AAFR65_08120 [Pseudomonadota bacterium]